MEYPAAKLIAPRFEQFLYSERCSDFFDTSQDFRLTDRIHAARPEEYERFVEWKNESRYILEQRTRETRNVFGLKRLEHTLFKLAIIGSFNEEGYAPIESWYIQKPVNDVETVTLQHHLIAHEDLQEAPGTVYLNSQFVTRNHLDATNETELKQLKDHLLLGRLDNYFVPATSPYKPEETQAS